MQASYNNIAQWYDQFLRERPIYTEVILPNLLMLIGKVEGVIAKRKRRAKYDGISTIPLRGDCV